MKLWIARDIDNILVLFLSKPVLCDNSGMWYVPFEGKNNPDNIIIDKNLFPDVTYENSPQEVELKLIKK